MKFPARWTRFPDALALLGVAVLVLLWFAPAALVQGVYFYGDSNDYFARLFYSAARLRAGELALWNPYLSLGGPHLADPAALAGYLPALALFLLLPAAAAYNYTVLLHYLLAAAGIYQLARAWGQSPPAAFLAALAFAFSGFVIAHLQHLNILVGLAWLPWLWFCVERWLDTRRPVYLLLGSVVFGLQLLGGHTQIVLYGAVAWGSYALVWLARAAREEGARAALPRALGLMGLAAGGLGLAAFYLVPLVELLQFTARSGGVTYAYATSFSLEPVRLLAWLYPYLFGGNWGSVERGAGSLIEMSGYVGLLPLALAPLGLTRRSWRTVFLAVLFVGALLLALGSYTPLYSLVYRLPLFGSVRAPARFLLLTTLVLALLAGFGLDVWRNSPRPSRSALEFSARDPRRSLPLLILLAVVLGALALLLAPTLGLPLSPTFALAASNVPALAAALITAFAALTLLIFWTRGLLSPRVLVSFALLLVAADLFFFAANFRYNALAPLDTYTRAGHNTIELGQTPFARTFYWAAQETKQASLLQQGQLAEYRWLARAGLRQSLPVVFGVYSLQGYGSEPASYTAVMEAIGANGTFDSRAARLIALYGGEYILSQSELDTPELVQESQENGVKLYRHDAALPRAFLVSRVIPARTSDDALALILAPDFDPRREVVVERLPADAPAAASSVTTPPSAPVQVTLAEPERLVLEVETETPAVLVLNDAYYPGWQASVDGQATPIYPANVLVRAVAVPAGRHTVEFVYDPLSVKIGGLISALSFGLIAILLAYLHVHVESRNKRGKTFV